MAVASFDCSYKMFGGALPHQTFCRNNMDYKYVCRGKFKPMRLGRFYDACQDNAG
jgi:hypothetical protein